jgi:hypothetical protein
MSLSAAVLPGRVHSLAHAAICSSISSSKTSALGCWAFRGVPSSTPKSIQRNSSTKSSFLIAKGTGTRLDISFSQTLKQGDIRWPASPKNASSEFRELQQVVQVQVSQPAPFLEHLQRSVLHPVVQPQCISSDFTRSGRI